MTASCIISYNTEHKAISRTLRHSYLLCQGRLKKTQLGYRRFLANFGEIILEPTVRDSHHGGALSAQAVSTSIQSSYLRRSHFSKLSTYRVQANAHEISQLGSAEAEAILAKGEAEAKVCRKGDV